MSLVDQLEQFVGGFIVNCEFVGSGWLIFIGRVLAVGSDQTRVSIRVSEVVVFDMTGAKVYEEHDYTLDWLTTQSLSILNPIDSNGRLTFFIPHIDASVILYPEGQGRPPIALAMAHLKEKRYS